MYGADYYSQSYYAQGHASTGTIYALVLADTVALISSLSRNLSKMFAESLTLISWVDVINKFLTLTDSIVLDDVIVRTLNGARVLWERVMRPAASTWAKVANSVTSYTISPRPEVDTDWVKTPRPTT